jgi:hypothetical protein
MFVAFYYFFHIHLFSPSYLFFPSRPSRITPAFIFLLVFLTFTELGRCVVQAVAL